MDKPADHRHIDRDIERAGLGTAFHMWATHLSGDVRAIATVSRNVVRADFLFTTPAVIIQPLSGAVLIWLTATDPMSRTGSWR